MKRRLTTEELMRKAVRRKMPPPSRVHRDKTKDIKIRRSNKDFIND